MADKIWLTIKGNPVSKKNHSQIIKTGDGKLRLIPSKSYRDYRSVFLSQVPAAFRVGLNTPHRLKAVYYMANRRRVDLNNLIAATADLLVAANVLEDDNAGILYSLDGSRVQYDKANPRVEIELTAMAEGMG